MNIPTLKDTDKNTEKTILKKKKPAAIEKHLERWKKSLIDFSKKNQLLFFKPKKTLSVFFKEEINEVYRKLVLESKTLQFVASREVPEEIEEIEEGLAQDLDTVVLPGEDEPPPGMLFGEESPGAEDEEALDQFIDAENSLFTDKPQRDLNQTLGKLRSRSKTSVQEQGINILYLSLYFLEWEESKSPIILVPVKLQRKGLNGEFTLDLIEDDIRINPTLAYKLKRDYNIDLQILEQDLQEIDSLEMLESLRHKLSATLLKDIKANSSQEWQIVDEAYLSLLSFAKLSLYRDIEDNAGKILEHKVIRKIAGENIHDSELFNPELLIEANEIDQKVKLNEAKQILDADSSQQEAIYAARAGQSFVIQGPPGTGKSQTISNIIAESLAQNKRVLFVSEKKSALEVVVNRLKESNLDKFCFEMHNTNQKKSETILSLSKSIDEIKNLAAINQRQKFLPNLNEISDELKIYIDELHRLHQPLNKSLFEIYTQLAAYKDIPKLKESFTIPNIEKLNLEKITELNYFFDEVVRHEEIITNYNNYMWRGAKVQNFSFEVENQIKSQLIEFKGIINKLASFAEPVSNKYFGREVKNIREFRWLAEASDLAINSPFPNRQWFEVDKLGEIKSLTLKAKMRHEEYRNEKDKILSRYSEGFLSIDHENMIYQFSHRFDNFFRYFNLDYWKNKGQLKQLTLYNESQNLESLVKDLKQAALLDKQAKELTQEGTELSLALGDFYQDFDTNWEETLTAITWVEKVAGKFNRDLLPSNFLEVVTEGKNTEHEEFTRYAKDLVESSKVLNKYLEFYNSLFPHPNLNIDHIDFDQLEAHLEMLITDIAKLEDWIDFQEVQNKARALGLQQFFEAIIKTGEVLEASDIRKIFLQKFYELWADKIEIENPRVREKIRKFTGAKQELLIKKFNEADLQLIDNNKRQIAHSLALNWIEYCTNPDNKKDIQTLYQEINKKKRHKAIRTLVQEIPELLQTLKPCWMMSPLSVSQLLDSEGLTEKDFKKLLAFDLVIFDEASQIRTEDAICAIYRGKQLILAGDSNQLPPTNFFNSSNTEEEDFDDDDDIESFESILDECAVFLPNKYLTWHYRSRNEDLIKFSNYHIYGNKLISFPSPNTNSERFGVGFEYIENGRYERGARYNRKEAKRVAEAILEHYGANPDISLGVIAFSEAQQMAIERELAALIKKHTKENPELDYSFLDEERNDALFIKNLENVQGDERDVIYFSIGYAHDRKGNLSHNFGPLNRDGGHRRLNVAITRARNKMKVFASIKGVDIDSNRSSAQGAMLLKKFLTFAEEPNNLLGQFDNEFEKQMAELSLVSQKSLVSQDGNFDADLLTNIGSEIMKNGYQVELSVGASDYKIDLVVKSESGKRALLAIETDGEIYKSANTARDRERLRPNVLKSLGWKVHRVWSRDWIRDREGELEKIVALLQ